MCDFVNCDSWPGLSWRLSKQLKQVMRESWLPLATLAYAQTVTLLGLSLNDMFYTNLASNMHIYLTYLLLLMRS